MVALRGTLTVASSHKPVSAIGPDIGEREVVIFDFSGAAYIDDSAATVLEQLLEVAAESGTACVAMGLADDAAATLETLEILRDVPEDRIVGTQDDARRAAGDILAARAASPAEDRSARPGARDGAATHAAAQHRRDNLVHKAPLPKTSRCPMAMAQSIQPPDSETDFRPETARRPPAAAIFRNAP